MITAQQARKSKEMANLIRIPREHRQYFDGDTGIPMWGEGFGTVKGFWDTSEVPPKFSKNGARRAYTIGKKAKKIVEIFVSSAMYIEPDLDGSVKKELEELEDMRIGGNQ